MKNFVPPVLALLLSAPSVAAQNLQPDQSAKQQFPATPAQAQVSTQSNETVVEEIIARINNSIITLSELQRSKEALATEAKSDPQPGEKPREQDLLRDLIDQQLLIAKANELDITADTDVVKRLDELRKQMHAESMEDLEKAAQAQGVSFEEFKNNLKNSILTQKVIQQEVGGHITVTQQEIQQFYDQHKAEMERPEQVRLSEILVSTQKTADLKTPKGQAVLPEAPDAEVVAAAQKKADEIYAELQKGAKFADLAKKDSDGPTSADGGDLEYFKRGTLSKELEDKVFVMKAGEYTTPIRTNQGFVILEVTEHQTAGVPPLKDVATQVQERLYMEKMQPALREYLTKLREDAYIDIKAGYIDTGASPNETKPIYTTADEAGAKKLKKKKKFGVF